LPKTSWKTSTRIQVPLSSCLATAVCRPVGVDDRVLRSRWNHADGKRHDNEDGASQHRLLLAPEQGIVAAARHRINRCRQVRSLKKRSQYKWERLICYAFRGVSLRTQKLARTGDEDGLLIRLYAECFYYIAGRLRSFGRGRSKTAGGRSSTRIHSSIQTQGCFRTRTNSAGTYRPRLRRRANLLFPGSK